MKDIVEINRKEIVVDAVLDELDNVTDYISEYLAEMGCSTPMEIKINIACEEIFVNIAYYAYEDMFANIKKIADKHGCLFSLYVDDMTFSSETPFNKDVLEREIDIEENVNGNNKQAARSAPRSGHE